MNLELFVVVSRMGIGEKKKAGRIDLPAVDFDLVVVFFYLLHH
jgi:hypothetical protein